MKPYLSLITSLLLANAVGKAEPAVTPTTTPTVTTSADWSKPALFELSRRIRIDADFLQLPLLQREAGRKEGVELFTIEDGGQILRYVHLQIAGKDQPPDFWYSYDVREFRGREVTLHFESNYYAQT